MEPATGLTPSRKPSAKANTGEPSRIRPKHNGKVERYNRILSEELLYARTWRSEQERVDALVTWNVHYNYHRPHGAHGGQPPASATPSDVNNVLASYS